MMQLKKIGWDVGGAHIKAVLLDKQGHVISALQVSSPLWQGLGKLELGVHDILRQMALKPNEALHAVTMTGELADIFSNRHTGVMEISNKLVQLLGKNTFFYSSQPAQKSHNLLVLDKVSANTKLIASANWHASASYIAQKLDACLMIDVGSTTTDIIPIVGNAMIDIGLSDAGRMQQDSLVYTGVIRTPVMALTQKIMWDDIETNVAGECFATMADVYRLTGELDEDKDMAGTADGKCKTKQNSARRLARMVGHDVEDKPLESWVRLALAFRAAQIKQLKLAVKKHLKPRMPIVGVGAGAFLVKVLAEELNRAYIDVTEIVGSDVCQHVSMCLPAYAVAYFTSQQTLI
jgi:probable H4MPT-linked C1 transfer pathway protein